ncbi:MAG: DUF448 domain-containing protein [Proteobacteria bacterium]|nr:DUF448 domain-containing protein [Pseudomonadota bacterium]
MSDQMTHAEPSGHHEPQRRCISCRGNGAKYGLLRFALVGGMLCFDLRKKLPGRGYYVCAQRSCLENAFQKGFKRAAKSSPKEIAENADAFIREILIPGLRKRYTECLLAGFQSHMLLLGADSVEQAAQADTLAAYVIATDASESTSTKYRTNASRKNLPCLGLYDRSFYGRLFGKSDKVVLGWLSCHLFEEFSSLEASIRRLESV